MRNLLSAIVLTCLAFIVFSYKAPTKKTFVDESYYLAPAEMTKPRMVILFTFNDCPLCLFETEMWSKAQDEIGDKVSIVAVTQNAQTADLDGFIEEYGVSFDIINDPNTFLVMKQNLLDQGITGKTPIKVFVNQNNEIVNTEGGNADMQAQSLLLRRIAATFQL